MYKNKEWFEKQISEHKTIARMSKATGYPETTLSRWCKKHELNPTKDRQSTDRVTKGFLIEQYKQGKEIREIADEFHLSTATIVNKNKDFGISATDYNPRYKYNDKDWLSKQFENYGNISNVAKQTGYPRASITRAAIKFGLHNSKFNRLPINDINENYFECIDTPDKAYYLGFIMADGNMYKSGSGRLQFSIKLKSTDADIIYKFAKAIEYKKDKIVFGAATRKNTGVKFVEIRSGNRVFCNNLVKNGIIPRKTGFETIPSTVPKEYTRDFIRGFIDGDGWVYYKNKCIGVCSCSKEIIESIVDYFSEYIDITTKIYLKHNLYEYHITKSEHIGIIANHLYYDGCTALDRKYANARKLVDQYYKAK